MAFEALTSTVTIFGREVPLWVIPAAIGGVAGAVALLERRRSTLA